MAKTAKKAAAPAAPVNRDEIYLIPLNELVHSPLNMRRAEEYDQTAILTLANNIIDNTLLQNLVVTNGPTKGAPFEVVDGGRRLCALRMAAERGAICADYLVPCKKVTADEAIAASLSANHQREDVHPVAEAVAFAALVWQHKIKPAAIATRYGVSKRYVSQRLALAGVAPEVLEAARAGKLRLDLLAAFTVTNDQDKHRAVWARIEAEQLDVDANEIHDMLLGEPIDADHYLVKFVGLDAYREAGGRVIEDLFSNEENPLPLLADRALVVKLAQKKLAKALKKEMDKGWKWGKAEAGDDDFPGQKMYAVDDTFTDAERAVLGVCVGINWKGELDIEEGRLLPEDREYFVGLRKKPEPEEPEAAPAYEPEADEVEDDRQEPESKSYGKSYGDLSREVHHLREQSNEARMILFHCHNSRCDDPKILMQCVVDALAILQALANEE